MTDDERPRERLPDWQLPIGVDRALWEYLSDRSIAVDYDDYFRSTHLMELDREFLCARFTEPGRLVDLGCGTGRLVLDFAARGFEVTGVDLSDEMLGVCARKRAEMGVEASLVKGNICALPELPSASFDYALCMFSTLGMVVGPENRARALGEMSRLLKPGGRLGLHVHNRWYNLFDPQGRWWLLRDFGRHLMGSRWAGDKVQVRYRGIPNLRLHLFSRRELRRVLRRAGFHLEEMVPLRPNRTGGLYFPWFLPSLRANGWLMIARRLAEC